MTSAACFRAGVRVLDRSERTAALAEKIKDPLAHAGPEEFALWKETDLWGKWVNHCTTAQFSRSGGVSWHNNCGPTAVTNLMALYRRRLGQPVAPMEMERLYSQTARYGVRHLFYRNALTPFFHGTSDLRAGSYLRRAFSRFLGVRLWVRPRRATEKSLRQALDSGALLYLLLWGHPAYGNHHLVAYGYTLLRNKSTGEERCYLKTSDGHASAPRYLDMRQFQGRLRFFWEVRFPV